MKKFFPLCLLLIVALVWTVAVAGSMERTPTANASQQAQVNKAEKAAGQKSVVNDEMTPEKAAAIAKAAEENAPGPAEALQSNGTPGTGIAHEQPSVEVESGPHQKLRFDRPVSVIEYQNSMNGVSDNSRMEDLKADGVIDAGEKAEYEQLLADQPVEEIPQPFNIVSETEPNNDCASANSIACGDTVWCATQTTGSDDHDWFTFTLDNTYPSWIVTIKTFATSGACEPASSDTYLELWTGDCATLITYNDDNPTDYFSTIVAVLAPGSYAIHEDNTHWYSDGSYHLSVICEEDTCYGNAPPNDNCEDVTPTALTAGVPTTFTGNNECATNQCTSFPGPHVWEAFTIPTDGDVDLEYCGSSGVWGNVWLNLAYGCPCDSFTVAASYAFTCSDGNIQLHWGGLAAGTYYYPVLLDPAYGSVGDYSVTVTYNLPPIPWNCIDDPPNWVPPDGKTAGGNGDIEPNDACVDASPAQCEYAYCGDLSSSADVDWYTLTIPSDTAYSLHIRVFADDTPNQYAQGGGCDPWVGLYESDCTSLVASSEDYFGTFPDAETYDSQIDPTGYPNCFAPGSVVFIQVRTNYSAPGPYLLIINCEPCDLPSEFGSWTCPVGNTLFGQEPTLPSGGWSIGTSEIDVQGNVYKRFESFDNAGEITDIHFWGSKMYLGTSGWENCSEEPMTFLIEFWNDDGTGYPDISGAPVCSYTMAIPAVLMDSLYGGIYNAYEWSADLPNPCNMSSGYVSVQGQLDNTCWFLWMSSDAGDGSSWFLSNGVWTSYLYDNAVCLTGVYTPVYGACCDDATGTCTDNVEQLDCVDPLRFTANTLCADLDPPCGEVPGACCDPSTGDCTEVTEEVCSGLGFNYQGDWTTCNPNPCPLPPPSNDSCDHAITVPVPSDTPGSTTWATPDTIECVTSHSGPGVWYSVIGTGNTITATTCDASTDYDTKLLVFCNSCDYPICVTGNDDMGSLCTYSGLQSQVTWCSELGTEYLILVGGFLNSSGNFMLHVSDDGIACSNPPDCAPPQPCVDSVTVEIFTDSFPSETSWDLTDSLGTVIASGGPLSNANSLYTWNVCVDAVNCWTFTIYDAYGDGICCGYGDGYYNVYFDANLVATGGEFGTFESTEFGPACVTHTGACCVAEECVATNTLDECDVLGGQWFIDQDCANFTCPTTPRECDDPSMVYTNGNTAASPYISEYAVAQCDVSYPFQAATADDFVLPGADSVDIGAVLTWTWHWNGNLNGPGDYEGINVVVYENDDVTVPGENHPGGYPVDGDPNCAHVETIAGGIVYETTVLSGGFSYIALGGDVYRLDIPVNVKLAAGVTYWLEVQPIMQFGLGGQSGLTNSEAQVGEYLQRYMPLLGINTWTASGDLQDMAFCLLGGGGGGDCCVYTVGDVNGSDSYNGLDITYGVAFFKGGPDPMCNDCTVDDCNTFNYCGDVNGSNSYNGLDITYGVAYFKGGPAPVYPSDCPPCGGIAGGFATPQAPSVNKAKPVIEQKPNLK